MSHHLPDTLAHTLSPHLELGKSRLQTLSWLIIGLVNARTVNLSHLASQCSGSAQVASSYRRQAGAAARGAPTQAAAPACGHDVAPGRLQPRMGGGRDVGPGGDLGRCDQRGLLGLFRRRGRHYEQFPGAFGGDRRAGPVLLALCRSGGALLAHAEGRRQGRQGQSDPGGPGASAARHRADRGLFAGGAGALGAHVWDLAEALAPGAAPGRDHHQTRRQPLPRGGLLAGPQRALCPAGSAFSSMSPWRETGWRWPWSGS